MYYIFACSVKGHCPEDKGNLHPHGTVLRSVGRWREGGPQCGGLAAEAVPTSHGELPVPPGGGRADAANLMAGALPVAELEPCHSDFP